MESRILKNKLKSAKSSDRFKHSKKPLGRFHIVRVIFLVALTAGVTWYSRQESNNPFTLPEYIEIVGSKGSVAIKHVYNKYTTLIVPNTDFSDFSFSKLSMGKPWSLISLPPNQKPTPEITPTPTSWKILGPKPQNLSFPSEPLPKFSNDYIIERKTRMEWITPFNDTRRMLLVRIHSINCLVIDSALFCDTQDSTIWKEKIELLIVYNHNLQQIECFRNRFRPRFIVANTSEGYNSPIAPRHTHSDSNIFFPERRDFSFVFGIERNKLVKSKPVQ